MRVVVFFFLLLFNSLSLSSALTFRSTPERTTRNVKSYTRGRNGTTSDTRLARANTHPSSRRRHPLCPPFVTFLLCHMGDRSGGEGRERARATRGVAASSGAAPSRTSCAISPCCLPLGERARITNGLVYTRLPIWEYFLNRFYRFFFFLLEIVIVCDSQTREIGNSDKYTIFEFCNILVLVFFLPSVDVYS